VVWAEYGTRISAMERANIAAAPVVFGALAREPHSYISLEILQARGRAHVQVPFIAASLAKGHLDVNIANIRFAECLVIASFELRHRLVESWPGFALLFHKMFGPAVQPWLPALFLAGLAQPGCLRPQFDLEEVLGFLQRTPGH
jgi:hypothetical protein